MAKEYVVICELNGFETEMKGTLAQFKKWLGVNSDGRIENYVYSEVYKERSWEDEEYTRKTEDHYYSDFIGSLLSAVNYRNEHVEKNIGVAQPRYWLKECDDHRYKNSTIEKMINRTHRSCPSGERFHEPKKESPKKWHLKKKIENSSI